MSNDARRFDGKLKSAKEICDWAAKPDAVIYGPTHATEDDHDAGVNIVGEHDGAPHYTTVNEGDWIVRGKDGDFGVFTDTQYQFAFGTK